MIPRSRRASLSSRGAEEGLIINGFTEFVLLLLAVSGKRSKCKYLGYKEGIKRNEKKKKRRSRKIKKRSTSTTG